MLKFLLIGTLAALTLASEDYSEPVVKQSVVDKKSKPKLQYTDLIDDGCYETPESSCTANPHELYSPGIFSKVCSEFFYIRDQQYMFVGGKKGESYIYSFDPYSQNVLSPNPVDTIYIEGKIEDCKKVTFGDYIYIFVATSGAPSYIFKVNEGSRPGTKTVQSGNTNLGQETTPYGQTLYKKEVVPVWLSIVKRLHHNGLNKICPFGKQGSVLIAFSNWDTECDALHHPYCSLAPLYYWDGSDFRFAAFANVKKTISCAAWENYEGRYVSFVERDHHIKAISRITTHEVVYEHYKFFLRPIITDFTHTESGQAADLKALEKNVHSSQLLSDGHIGNSGRLCDVSDCEVIEYNYETWMICAINTGLIEDGEWDGTRIDLSADGQTLHNVKESVCLLSPKTMWIAKWKKDSHQWVEHQCINDAVNIADIKILNDGAGCCPMVLTCSCCDCCRIWAWECLTPSGQDDTYDKTCEHRLTEVRNYGLPTAVKHVSWFTAHGRNFLGLSATVNHVSPVWELSCAAPTTYAYAPPPPTTYQQPSYNNRGYGYEAPKRQYAPPVTPYAPPVYTAPQPVYQAPQPVYQAPKPTYSAPKPTYQAPQPTTYQQAAPVYQAPQTYQPVSTNPYA